MTKWTDDFLDKMRQTMDPLADEAARALFEGQGKKEIFNQLKDLATNDFHVPTNFPVELKSFFETSIPEFTKEELEKFEVANRVFDQYGYRICGLLFFKSLPTGYMCSSPAHVLGTTKLLENQATRRVFETGQFLFDACQAEWLDPDGRGIITIKKVRLMHAGMRGFILYDNDDKWNISKLGKPINQEDLVLTNQLFSLATIEGLRQMGVYLTTDEQEAYFYKWKIIGRILGIDPALEPNDVADGWNLQNKILGRNISENNPDGPELTKQLLNVIDKHSPFLFNHRNLEKIVYYFLNDQRAVQSLGLHKPGRGELLFDKFVQVLVKSNIWHHIFPHRVDTGSKLKWLYSFIQKQLAKRWGLQPTDEIDPKSDLMEMLCKSIVDHMEKKATLSSNTKFKVHDRLLREWQLGGFDFSHSD